MISKDLGVALDVAFCVCTSFSSQPACPKPGHQLLLPSHHPLHCKAIDGFLSGLNVKHLATCAQSGYSDGGRNGPEIIKSIQGDKKLREEENKNIERLQQNKKSNKQSNKQKHDNIYRILKTKTKSTA